MTENSIVFDPLATCDKCRAKAYAISKKGSYELTWCRHHALELMSKLESQGWVVTFNTALIQDMIKSGTPVPV